jgi:hypothetical protein
LSSIATVEKWSPSAERATTVAAGFSGFVPIRSL